MTAGLLISAPASGTGKTTLTLGLIAAMRAQGVKVHGFKNGPDYIDPAFHAVASGLPSYNLDCWAMPESQIGALIESADGADIIMRKAQWACLTGGLQPAARRPKGDSRSRRADWLAGDLGAGCQRASTIGGRGRAWLCEDAVRCDDCGRGGEPRGSPRHEAMVRDGLAQAGIPCLGCLPRRPNVELPERHLGLVQAQENAELETILAQAGAFIAEHLDLDAIRAVARPSAIRGEHRITPPGQRIALAQDVAFSFIYPHLLQGWHDAGAEILPFSPLKDEGPDPQADICWLPGGYPPELHAGALAQARHFRDALRAFAQTRPPVHGECGGYMALGAGLIDKGGTRHEMAGLLGLVTSYEKRKMHLGYRIATLHAPIPNLAAGGLARGHEFHYSTIIDQPDAPPRIGPRCRWHCRSGNRIMARLCGRGPCDGELLPLCRGG